MHKHDYLYYFTDFRKENDLSNSFSAKLNKRIFKFVVNTIKYLKSIRYSKINSVFIYQLSKAASAIGSNFEEAQGASSTNDFLYKLSICHREAKESNYWLRLLMACNLDNNSELHYLIQESDELKRLIGSIVGKYRNKQKKS